MLSDFGVRCNEDYVKIFIKNMVCLRCILLVKDEMERLGMEYEEVKLGEALIKEPVLQGKIEALNEALLKSGLEIIDDKKSRLVQQIKTVVIEQVHYAEEPLEENFSSFLAAKLNYDYTYLSNLFASSQGMTLEHYILWNKIEKVKELLIYEELTIAEIAFRMNYSSAAHLSKQFKKITGFTATYFKELKKIRFDETRKKKK
jgi:AraC-like DNA-binding protein